MLERLTPAERVAFVMHDMFAVPFEDIAPIVGRSVEATRQLASRARRRASIAPNSARSSRPSWRPCGAATSKACSRSSTRTSWCAPTWPRARRPRSAVRPPGRRGPSPTGSSRS
ncbi:MAG TPA: sigma factor-like helix-turn-helix DNA-binding protein [Thermoanaerobaculia bacterium]|nr:sigma factor-like helix-turn-helix DNA-binding protein [Thermoanaerobaculia bacterium]